MLRKMISKYTVQIRDDSIIVTPLLWSRTPWSKTINLSVERLIKDVLINGTMDDTLKNHCVLRLIIKTCIFINKWPRTMSSRWFHALNKAWGKCSKFNSLFGHQ